MFASVGFLLLGFLLLYGGGEWLVRGAGNLALRFGMSPFLVGMTIVAFATSAPELAVSLQAALNGVDDIAIGNVVGSNIANIGLILGICALLTPTVVRMRLIQLDLPWLIVASGLLTAFLYDGGLNRVGGIVLLAGLAAFLFWNIRVGNPEQEEDAVKQEFEAVVRPRLGASVDVLLILLGLVALVGGGAAFVRGGVDLAEALGVPSAVIALTIVAIGTSLPELATSIVAAARGDADIAVGNVVGSNFFNILAILGITATIQPLERGGITMVDMGVMLAFTIALLPLILVRRCVGRPEGAVLLAGYAAYVSWLVVNAL
ncbi:MAG: calcium/sodium antiporter [Gammaproteobacteria bacterium]|jgi:cation:H+ antiporter